MKMISPNLIVSCLILSSLVQGKQQLLRKLRPREQHQDQHAKSNQKVPTTWNHKPAGISASSGGGDESHRRLFNGGGVFIASLQMRDYVEWCMDAVEGTAIITDYNGVEQYPAVGLRPCAYMAGPSEQLFRSSLDGSLESRFPGDFCLMLGGFGNSIPKDGDRVRLGKCETNADYSTKADFSYDENDMINHGRGKITVASNSSLCVTYSGNNPDDDDRMIVKTCQDNDKFFFSFRTGWYELGGNGCVQVQDGKMQVGSRVVNDNCNGFASHWRIDRDGLFHSRKNDQYCMAAVSEEEGSAIRIALCDSNDDKQRWEWPQGEAPITLMKNPGFYLEVQGQGNIGDPMVLGTVGEEWSGDSVHI